MIDYLFGCTIKPTMNALVKMKKLREDSNFELPKYETLMSAGVDLRADIDSPITLRPMARTLVPCGFAMQLPVGYEAQVRPRSGLALKNGVTVLNTPGTIDADYRGEVKIILINLDSDPFIIEPQMRVAQMVIAKCEQAGFELVADLDDTSRGAGGFGSTGTK
jgi:dUTP pyrophosphatase